MATWTGQNKSSAPTYTNVQNSTKPGRMPIGLLLALTYSKTSNPLDLTYQSKSATPTYTNLTKN